MLPIRNISYLLPMCCSFWEKCKNWPGVQYPLKQLPTLQLIRGIYTWIFGTFWVGKNTQYQHLQEKYYHFREGKKEKRGRKREKREEKERKRREEEKQMKEEEENRKKEENSFMFKTFDFLLKTCIICQAEYWKGFRGSRPPGPPERHCRALGTCLRHVIFRKNTALLNLGGRENTQLFQQYIPLAIVN